MNQQITKWLKENSMIVVLLALFFIVPIILRMIDDTAASFDAGILHTIVLVCVTFAIYQACTWSIVKTIWPDVGRYFKYFFANEFKHTDNNTRMKLALGIYFTILLSLTLLTCAIL